MKLQNELSELIDRGLTFETCVEAFGVSQDIDPFAKTAADLHHEEGVVEIDRVTVLSESDEGAYVMAWVWVSNSDAGIQCGADAE